MSGQDSAAVIMTGINLALAALLLAAIFWRVGNRTALGFLIIGAGAGFALAVPFSQIGRSAGTPSTSIEKRMMGIETNVNEFSQQIKDTQEAITSKTPALKTVLVIYKIAFTAIFLRLITSLAK